ncbi:MAG TPA: hypothetical protein VEV82_06610 [Actinomycetota bacterium]|nr:hypothetical protein [Actinomycetota bacterium]
MTTYGGVASCYVEFAGGPVARVDVDTLTGPTPQGHFQSPSLGFKEEKAEFASSRRGTVVRPGVTARASVRSDRNQDYASTVT